MSDTELELMLLLDKINQWLKSDGLQWAPLNKIDASNRDYFIGEIDTLVKKYKEASNVKRDEIM